MTKAPDFAALKKDFPILHTERNGRPLVFLDSAASSQRPTQVLDAMDWMYNNAYANVHRGVYGLAEAATNAYESARLKVARFIGAPDSSEVIFTKNATEALNLVARSWGGTSLGPGDAIVLTTMEHHANIVPWQMMAAEKGFEIRWIPLGNDGQLDLTDLDVLLDGAQMLSVTSMSNVLGTITPLDRLIRAAHSAGAKVCVDACQSVPHMRTRVDDMGADFVAFSGHKMLGPSGIGVLWGRHELLEAMPPFSRRRRHDLQRNDRGVHARRGSVEVRGRHPSDRRGRWSGGRHRLSRGDRDGPHTPARDRAHVLCAAHPVRAPRRSDHDPRPLRARARGGVISIALEGVHAHDVSQVLDGYAVAVRPGHHCAKPLMRELGVNATARASFYLYNDTSDVDLLADALIEAHRFFAT